MDVSVEERNRTKMVGSQEWDHLHAAQSCHRVSPLARTALTCIHYASSSSSRTESELSGVMCLWWGCTCGKLKTCEKGHLICKGHALFNKPSLNINCASALCEDYLPSDYLPSKGPSGWVPN